LASDTRERQTHPRIPTRPPAGGVPDEPLARVAGAIRRDALTMLHHAGSGHPGGSLSCADILAVLYFRVMRLRPDEPQWPARDRLVLSKGHSCPALYAALALRGYFDRNEYRALRSLGGLLQGHPDVGTPGIDAPSGSLGMGLSQGLGMALGSRHQGLGFRTFVILGDGDMQEGNTWEALMAAGVKRVGSLTAILDANGLQGDARVEQQMSYEPIAAKVAAFGWEVRELDGHDLDALLTTLEAAPEEDDPPRFVVARTVKGKGVSFMEDQQHWHGSVAISAEELAQAHAELDAQAHAGAPAADTVARSTTQTVAEPAAQTVAATTCGGSAP
jgi:transketolase